MKIVLDTNVLISGLISQGSPPGDLIEAWKSGRFSLVISTAQLLEFRRVLGYRRLQKFINPAQARSLVETIVAVAEVIDQDLPAFELSADPDDNQIIATAIVGEADFIVSGDKSDLVVLSEIEGIPILTPRQALKEII